MADPTNTAAAPEPKASGTGAQPDPLVGRVINERFKILSVLARGGMGKVYKAEQAPLGRVCAVKVLNPSYAGDTDPEFHKRFFLEASIASKLTHPNTVTIFDYGRTDDDVYYMAMEYLEGRTLHRLIKESSPLDPQRAMHIARQICRSLREAHGLGVIHRDLKPANVFLIKHDDESDFVKVLDFGLVKNVEENNAESLTQTGLFMGSPKYMAPEQIRGERVTACTDIYALGVVLYEMLTGKVPFDRGNSVNTLMAHVSDPVPPMSETAPGAVVPLPLEEVVLRCLSKRADDRYASMDELLGALKRAGSLAFGTGGTGEFHTGTLSVSGEVAMRPTGEHAAYDPKSTNPALSIALRVNPSTRPSSAPVSDSSHTPLAASVPVAQPSVPPPAGAKARGPLVAVVALVGLGLLGGGVALLRGGGGASAGAGTSANPSGAAVANASAGASASASGAAGTSASPSPTSEIAVAGSFAVPANNPSAGPPHTLRVALDSTPVGAEVFEAGRSLGRTPLRLEWTGEQADSARAHTFTFRLANYREAQVTMQGSALVYTAELQPAPRVGPRPSARPSARGPYRDLPDDWR